METLTNLWTNHKPKILIALGVIVAIVLYRRSTKKDSMPPIFNRRKPSVQARFIAFLQHYGLIIVFALVTILYLIPFIKRTLEKQNVRNIDVKLNADREVNAVENGTNSPEIQKKKTKEIAKKYPKLTNAKIQEISTNAQRMAIALGTDTENNRHLFGYPTIMGIPMPIVYGSRYSEDEAEAVSIAKKHTGTFPLLAELYYSVYTRSRNLKTDLHEWLTKAQLNEIREAHKNTVVITGFNY